MEINLQLFAAEDEGRTERATPKKREDARRKGQVLQSREITAAVGLLAVFLGVRVFGGYIYNEILKFIRKICVEYMTIDDLYSYNKLHELLIEVNIVLFKTAFPILALALLAAFVTGYAQIGMLFTTETIKFRLDRINPFRGFKRLFSGQSVVQLVKSFIKVSIVFYIGYSYLKGQYQNVIRTMDMDVLNIASYIGTTVINLAIRMCIGLMFLAILDYIYQWWEYEKSLKMSKQEVKEEYKQLEGNPEVRAKIRQKQKQVSMRRMLHEVPKADVVITNPDHYAVALKYDEKVDEAPVLLAKGQDFVAQRIKEVAKDNGVQMVENPTLARAIYNSVEIGEAIPRELYQAVAEVLAFVYSMREQSRHSAE